MKKTTALCTFGLLITLTSIGSGAVNASRSGPPLIDRYADRTQAPPQAVSAPRWQSRQEYDAYAAMTKESDPRAQLALAQAFLQRFPTSDFKLGAYLTEMECYRRLNNIDPALNAARNALRIDRDNLDALRFLSFVFPFTYKDGDPGASAILTRAEDDARHGLNVLQGMQKPAKVSNEQFMAYVLPKRAIFNDVLGFAALQRKDYAGAIAALRAAVAANPDDILALYRMGLAYLYSTPTDYHHGIWYVARAAGLAQASHNPSSYELRRYLRKVFDDAVGNDAAMDDTIRQALASVDPPGGPGHVGSPRPRPAPGQGGSTRAGQGPSGQPSTARNDLGTSPVIAVIYPGWLPPPDDGENSVAPSEEEGNSTPPPSPTDLDHLVTEQLNNLIDFTSPQQSWQDAGLSQFPPAPAPEPTPPMTVLVYKDGHKIEVQNYAIMGKSLVWFSGELSKKIPLAELDLAATRKVNEDHGVTFATPDEP